ncbi:hypothetical protein [Acetoanaerobium noterae]|uniref:hypothetical protein n=1 Tax=Acetoanaerobium noterae TaxID=745369 RepID=UPI00333015E4
MINKLKVFYNEYISITLIIIFIGIFSAASMNLILYNGIPCVETNISRDGWASFSGAFIGGALTLIGVNITIKNEARRRREEDRRRREEEKSIIILGESNKEEYCFAFKIDKIDTNIGEQYRFTLRDFKITNVGKNPVYKIMISFYFKDIDKPIDKPIDKKYERLIKSGEEVDISEKIEFNGNDKILESISITFFDVFNNVHMTEFTCKSENKKKVGYPDDYLMVNDIQYKKVAERI